MSPERACRGMSMDELRMVSTQTSSQPNGVNDIVRQVATDSRITGISLYFGRAEVNRLFKFDVKKGQNRALIQGFPSCLQEDTFRVGGEGNASILDVVVSRSQISSIVPAGLSPDPLKHKLEECKRALVSARESRTMLRNYLSTVGAASVDISQLDAVFNAYESLTSKADTRITDLENEVDRIQGDIRSRMVQSSDVVDTQRWQAVVLLDGQVDEEVVLNISYVVTSASWEPGYDIRVDTQAKEDNTSILYKASISQCTGESWQNVPLTLETVTPTFGVPPPIVEPWNLSVCVPRPPDGDRDRDRDRSRGTVRRRVRSHPYSAPSHHPPTSPSYSPASPCYSPTSPSFEPVSLPPLRLTAPNAQVTSDQSAIAATFKVPGVVDIMSDGSKHTVTITQFTVDADIQWYSAPLLDNRTHLKAKIKNTSGYSLIHGPAHIFVNGSFVASNAIPPVTPQETFDCALGLDPSVKITYHPREKKVTQGGFYQKSSTYSFTQRITVVNTKSTGINNLKIVDHIPVSQDDRIQVKLINPKLTEHKGSRAVVEVLNGVKGQWDGADDDKVDETILGKDGKLNWVLTLPPLKSVNLVLQYEVSHQEGIVVDGLL